MSHDSTITFNTPRMKVTDYVAHFLAERGVTAVFELSGGMITHTCWILRPDMEKPGS